MIAKHVPMRSKTRSSFAGLVNYITDNQNKTERVNSTKITNCESGSLVAAISEVIATQKLNTRAESDKTYHLIVSFPTGEQPDEKILEAIENRICEGLGYKEHQRISTVHNDTDNLHIHIAINKIHPEKLTIKEPYRDYKTLGSLCEELEEKFSLTKENHLNKKHISQNKVNDMEMHSGIESLVTWIKTECLSEITSAQSWEKLHEVLAENGLKIKEKGNGFIFESEDGIQVKASTVSRNLSKGNLEKKLGEFTLSKNDESTQPKKKYKKRPTKFKTDTKQLYEKYQEEQSKFLERRKAQWEILKNEKNIKIDIAKKKNKLRRATIKLMGGNPLLKKILYSQASKSLKNEIESIQQQYKEQRTNLYATKKLTWADWLKKSALEGDQRALETLRSRDAAKGLKGNTIQADNLNKKNNAPNDYYEKDNITKKGTVIYRTDKGAIRDDGNLLQVSKNAKLEAVREALLLAQQKYGNEITVHGSPQFKAQVVCAAAKFNLQIKFKDEILEKSKTLLSQQLQENGNEERRRNDRGTINRTGNGNAGIRRDNYSEYPGSRGRSGGSTTRTTTEYSKSRRNNLYTRNDSGNVNIKPNISGIGGEPPSFAKNRLRKLSELSVVSFARGSKVLLPSDVFGKLEHKGTKPDNSLRRGISGAGLDLKQIAIEQYINERESKRIKGFDIPKNSRYNNEQGELTYGGLRTVNEQVLALIKKDNEVFILPVEKIMAQKLKKLKIGDAVTISKNGIIKRNRGRSR